MHTVRSAIILLTTLLVPLVGFAQTSDADELGGGGSQTAATDVEAAVTLAWDRTMQFLRGSL